MPWIKNTQNRSSKKDITRPFERCWISDDSHGIKEQFLLTGIRSHLYKAYTDEIGDIYYDLTMNLKTFLNIFISLTLIQILKCSTHHIYLLDEYLFLCISIHILHFQIVLRRIINFKITWMLAFCFRDFNFQIMIMSKVTCRWVFDFLFLK